MAVVHLPVHRTCEDGVRGNMKRRDRDNRSTQAYQWETGQDLALELHTHAHAPIIKESIAYIATPTQNTPGSLHTVGRKPL
jgi:hypothetical protein